MREALEGEAFGPVRAPTHAETIREWPATVLRIHAIKSSGVPNLRKAMLRAHMGTQSYTDVASRTHMCASSSRAVLLWMRFAIMPRGGRCPYCGQRRSGRR